MSSMEIEQAENVGGEQSGDNGEVVEDNKYLSITMAENLSSEIKEKLKSLDDVLIDKEEGDKKQANKPKIPRVPTSMRENKILKKYFEPSVVSIGPYHHEKNLKVTKKMKLKLAAMFIKECRLDKEDLYLKIRMEIQNFRNYYEQKETKCYDDDKLAWILLIDGCAVLHSRSDDAEVIVESVSDMPTFRMDLLLLENQLPFGVLKLMIDSIKFCEELKLEDDDVCKKLKLEDGNVYKKLKLEDGGHLLDIRKKAYITKSVRNNGNSGFIMPIFEYLFKKCKLSDILSYIMELLLDRMLKTKKTIDIQNFEDLAEAGIEFKPINTGCLKDISFSHGTLNLPLISGKDSTTAMILNIIVYEMCTSEKFSIVSEGFSSGLEVSAYVFFLISLIPRVQDVKELRVSRILQGIFDNDEEIVKLVKEISVADWPESSKILHYKMLQDIKLHCENKYNVWKAELERNYFRSPWSAIAVAGAVFGLGLTFVSTVYSVLAYYN